MKSISSLPIYNKMKNTSNILLLLMLFSFVVFATACTEEEEVLQNDNPDNVSLHDCIYEYDENDDDGGIDAIERDIINACNDSGFTNIEDIRNNLIGEWELVGYGHGWSPKGTQPCCYVVITDTDIIVDYEDRYTDTVSTSNWTLEAIDITFPSPSTYHQLKITPINSIIGELNNFCENYMYGDSTPSDGNMYLFEKVQ